MNIGALSKKVGLTAKTIRFYEEIGLISPPEREDNGYRIYKEPVIYELKIIKNARELGLPIREIEKLMTGCKNGNCAHSKEYLIKEIGDYLKILEDKEKQMSELKTRLTSLKKTILENDAAGKNHKYCCNILGQITEMDKGGDEK